MAAKTKGQLIIFPWSVLHSRRLIWKGEEGEERERGQWNPSQGKGEGWHAYKAGRTVGFSWWDQPVQPPQWTRETRRTHKRGESDSPSTLPATVSRDDELAASSSTFTKASFSIVLNIWQIWHIRLGSQSYRHAWRNELIQIGNFIACFESYVWLDFHKVPCGVFRFTWATTMTS